MPGPREGASSGRGLVKGAWSVGRGRSARRPRTSLVPRPREGAQGRAGRAWGAAKKRTGVRRNPGYVAGGHEKSPGAYPPSQHEEDRRGVVRAFPTRFHPPGPAQEAGRPPRGAVLGSGRAGMLRLLAPLLSLALLPALARARGRQQAGRRAHTPPAGAATLRARRKLWLRPARSLRARARLSRGSRGAEGRESGRRRGPRGNPGGRA